MFTPKVKIITLYKIWAGEQILNSGKLQKFQPFKPVIFAARRVIIEPHIKYKPPVQLKFLKTLSNSWSKVDILSKKWHILEHMNINIYENGTIVQE